MLSAGADLAQGFSDASTAKANAKLSIFEAKSAIMAGEDKAAAIRREGERFQGTTRAAQAASGVDLSSGTAADVGRESAINIEKDALLAGFSGRQQAAAKYYEARLHKRQAKSAVLNASLKSTSTILGSAEKALTMGAGGG